MSYCRFGSDDSDVYVYGGSHSLVCCACAMGGPSDHFTFTSMIEHLRKHQDLGHCVPESVFDRLEKEKKKYGDIYPVVQEGWIKGRKIMGLLVG